MTGPALDAIDPAELADEFRVWARANRPADVSLFSRHAPMMQRAETSRAWERALAINGWLGITWPVEFGGRGMPVHVAAAVAQTFVEEGLPEIFNQVGLDLVGPAIVRHGTQEQKERHLRALLDGTIWCQGFSEPDAGSDLASLRTRADRVDGGWVLNGQKVWSTYAGASTWCIVLARTAADAPKHRGITCFLVPTDTPGLELRPIREITGDEEFFELYFTDVFVPDDEVLGPVDRGWQVAMDVLGSERTGIFTILGTVHEDLIGLAQLVGSQPVDEQSAHLIAATVDLLARGAVLRWKNDMCVENAANGAPMHRAEATMKVSWSELHQDVADLAIQATGLHGLVEPPDPSSIEAGRWLFTLLHARAETIYAGTSEIQRNIIAERVLGLPREATS